MKKVLIMGGSYFIGKKIVDVMVENNYSVFTLNRGTKKNEDPRITNLACDRNDEKALKIALKDYKFQIVIDVSGLDKGQAEKLYSALNTDTLETFIFLSSSAVYDVESLKIPFKETDEIKENIYWTDYGKNKIEAEAFYTEKFKNSKVKLIMIRPPYVYGENNYAQRESFIFEHICNNQPVLIPKSNPKLQFIYTTDLANIILELLKHNQQLENISIFNVGNKNAVTDREWVEACSKVVGKPVEIIEYDYKAAGRGVRDFFPFVDYDNVLEVSDINKIYSKETNFIEGLGFAYKWYLDNKYDIEFKVNVTRNEMEIMSRLK